MSLVTETAQPRPLGTTEATLETVVRSYHLQGPVEDFNSHRWTVDVRCDSLAYTVDRSYVDFCDIDRILRKRFPKTDLMPLPIASASVIQKHLSKDSSAAKSSRSTPDKTASSSAYVVSNLQHRHRNYEAHFPFSAVKIPEVTLIC